MKPRLARSNLKAVFIASGIVVCGIPAARGQDEVATAHASLNPLRSLDKATFKSFLQQPLFDPSRRLPPPMVAPQVIQLPPRVTVQEPPPSLHLLGIIHGKRDMAIIRRNDEAKTIVLSSGDRVGPWAVTVLPTLGMQLRNGDRVVDYALFGTAGAAPGSVSMEPGTKFPTR